MSGEKHPLSGIKTTPSIPLDGAPFSLALHLCSSYVITKSCRICTKTDSLFHKSHNEFGQTVQSPKSWSLAQTLHTIDKSNTAKCKFSDLPLLALKFSKFIMSLFEPKVSFSSNFHHSLVSWEISLLYFFI